MNYLPIFAVSSWLIFLAWGFDCHHTCDDCHEFDLSVRYRKGEGLHLAFQGNIQVKLCDKCMGIRHGGEK